MTPISLHIIPAGCTRTVPNVPSPCPILLVLALPFLPFLTGGPGQKVIESNEGFTTGNEELLPKVLNSINSVDVGY